MKIKSNLIFSIITTLFWVIFIIWNRFIRERLPKEIIFEPIINLRVITIACMFFISFSLLVYFSLKYFKIIPKPNSRWSHYKVKIINYLERYSWFAKTNLFIDQHVLNGPKNVYDNIIYQKVYLRPFIRNIGAKLSYYFQTTPLIAYRIGFLIPKTVPWIVFFLEITLYHKIAYFYKVLVILLIPLILTILLYMIKHHSEGAINWYREYFDFEYIDEVVHVYFKNLSNPSKEQLDKQETLSHFAGDEWFFYQNLYSICYKINEKKLYYQNSTNIVVYGLMAIDFFFYLLLLLGVIA